VILGVENSLSVRGENKNLGFFFFNLMGGTMEVGGKVQVQEIAHENQASGGEVALRCAVVGVVRASHGNRTAIGGWRLLCSGVLRGVGVQCTTPLDR